MSDTACTSPIPSDPRVVAECVPSELKPLPRWTCWKFIPNPDGGKPIKLPINPHTGKAAKIDDPSTWTTFPEAMQHLATDERLSGVMLAISTDLDMVGIDLDGCRGDDGELTPEAKALVETFDSYTEVSPSGTGVKLLCYGKKPGTRCRAKGVHGCCEVEIYSRDRFFVITGQRVESVSAEINERQVELDDLYAGLFPPTSDRPRGPGGPSGGFTGDDEALVKRARDAANGGKFTRLYDGGDIGAYGGDDSAADLALVSMIAFWTGPDYERIARIFRNSALYRSKWDRDDYRERTIDTALEGMTEFYGQRPARVSESGTALPEVELGPDEHRVIGEVITSLAADPDLYQRGGRLVRVIWIAEGKTPRPTIRELEPPTLREIITRNVVLMKFDAKTKEMVHAHPSGWLVSAVHSRGAWQGIRTLNGISQAPVLRPDGSVVQSPGYDAVTGVLYVPSEAFPKVPHDVNVDDASEAMRHLLDLVRDFPFASPAHAAAWVAGLLTIVARHTFTGNAPLFLVDANVRGAGKTLLAQIAGRIALGHEHLCQTDPPYNVKVEPRSNNAIAAGLSSFSATQPKGRKGSAGGEQTHHQKFDVERHPEKAKGTTKQMRAKDRPLANDFVSDEAFDGMLDAWFGNIARVLMPGGSFYIWGGYANLGNYPPFLKKHGLYFSQGIVWDKMHPVLTRKDYMGAFELAFYGWKEGAAHRYFGPNNETDLWHVKKVPPQQMSHLTEKPTELAKRAMEYSSQPGENVLDLFGGSGSSLIAAEQTGRKAFLMELDAPYCDVIVQRWENFTGKKAERRTA